MGSTASIDQNKASYRLALRQQDWLCAAAHKLDLRPTPTPKKLRLPVSRGGRRLPSRRNYCCRSRSLSLWSIVSSRNRRRNSDGEYREAPPPGVRVGEASRRCEAKYAALSASRRINRDCRTWFELGRSNTRGCARPVSDQPAHTGKRTPAGPPADQAPPKDAARDGKPTPRCPPASHPIAEFAAVDLFKGTMPVRAEPREQVLRCLVWVETASIGQAEV